MFTHRRAHLHVPPRITVHNKVGGVYVTCCYVQHDGSAVAGLMQLRNICRSPVYFINRNNNIRIIVIVDLHDIISLSLQC